MNDNTVQPSSATNLSGQGFGQKVPYKQSSIFGKSKLWLVVNNSKTPVDNRTVGVNTTLLQGIEKTGEPLRINSEDSLYGIFSKSANWDDPETLDMQGLRVDAAVHVASWTEKKLKGVFAALNKLLYHWGVGMGAIKEDLTENGNLIRTAIKAVAREAVKVHSILVCALDSIVDYAREWHGVKCDRRTMRNWLKPLADAGLFTYRSARNVKLPRQWVLNVPAMLLLAEAIEKRLVEDARFNLPPTAEDEEAFNVLPEHRGYTLKMLFDAILPGFGYHRDGEPDETEPSTYAETDERQDATLPRTESGITHKLRSTLANLADCARQIGIVGWIEKELQSLREKWPEHEHFIHIEV